jgi:hypothetical protein
MEMKAAPELAPPEARLGIAGVEAIIGLTAVYGGIALLRYGSGMPLEWLRGTPFPDWTLPGLSLMLIVGGTHIAASVALITGRPSGRSLSALAGLVLMGWIVAQVVLLRHYHLLQPTLFLAGLSLVYLSGNLPPRHR